MKPTSNYLEINRIAWNNKTEIHIASDFYDQTNFLKGKSSLKGIELELLGNIQGKSVLHLQCHFGQATASFIASHVENWTTNPFVKGAYSYSTIGMGDARKTASQALSEKLYFAGEAMNTNGHHQTVHGAVETGYREVMNILTDIKK